MLTGPARPSCVMSSSSPDPRSPPIALKCSPPVTTKMSLMPARTRFSSGHQIIGLSKTGRRCLFVTSVRGRRREPVPPARMMPFIYITLYFPWILSPLSLLLFLSGERGFQHEPEDEPDGKGTENSHHRMRTDPWPDQCMRLFHDVHASSKKKSQGLYKINGHER